MTLEDFKGLLETFEYAIAKHDNPAADVAHDALMSAIRSVFAERDALQARLEAAELERDEAIREAQALWRALHPECADEPPKEQPR